MGYFIVALHISVQIDVLKRDVVERSFIDVNKQSSVQRVRTRRTRNIGIINLELRCAKGKVINNGIFLNRVKQSARACNAAVGIDFFRNIDARYRFSVAVENAVKGANRAEARIDGYVVSEPEVFVLIFRAAYCRKLGGSRDYVRICRRTASAHRRHGDDSLRQQRQQHHDCCYHT